MRLYFFCFHFSAFFFLECVCAVFLDCALSVESQTHDIAVHSVMAFHSATHHDSTDNLQIGA